MGILKEGGRGMSFIDEAGKRIQYDAEDLIIKLKEDIRKYGIGKRVRVWCVKAHGVELYTNYNYMEEEPLLREKDVEHGVYFKKISMGELLPLFEKENSIL